MMMNGNVGDSSPLLTKEEAARFLKIPVRTLHYRRCARKGPPYRKIGRHVYYHRDDLEAFLLQCKVDPDSARG
jgi:hypothetical protein